MPRLPILPGDVSAAGVAKDPFGLLPPAQADGIRALEARDEGISRGLTVAEAWRDSVTVLQEAESAEDGAPAGFARDFFAIADRGRANVLRSALPGQRDALDNDLRGLRADLGDRAVTAEAAGLALRRRLGLMQTLETYAGGVAEDPGLFDSADGRITKLVEGSGLPETRARALRTEMRTRLANAAVDGLMADPAEAEAALRLGLYDDVLPKEIKQQRLAEAETQMQRARLLDGERRRQALSRRAAEGVADEAEIGAALADGGLSESEANRLRAQTTQAQQKAETRRARINRVAGGDPLDPANAEDRLAADAYWEDVSEAYAFDDPGQQQQAELDLVRRIGVLPTGLTRKYRGMLLSRDPEVVVQGARAITEIDHLDLPIARFVPPSRNGLRPLPRSDDPVVSKMLPARPSFDLETIIPRGERFLPPDADADVDRRRAILITDFTDLGLPADRAVELTDMKMSEEGLAASTTPGGEVPINATLEDDSRAGGSEEDDLTVAAANGDEGDGIGGADDPTAEEDSAPDQAAFDAEPVPILDDETIAALESQADGELPAVPEAEEESFVDPGPGGEGDLGETKMSEELAAFLQLTPGIGELMGVVEFSAAIQDAIQAAETGDDDKLIASLGAAATLAGVEAVGGVAGRRLRAFKQIAELRALREAGIFRRFEQTPGDLDPEVVNRVKNRKRPGQTDGAFDTTPDEAFKTSKFPTQKPVENIRRGLAAVDLVIENKLRGGKGVIRGAMHRPDIGGSITLHWGSVRVQKRTKAGKRDDLILGHGVSKILVKHGVEALEGAIETVARAKTVRRQGDRIVLEHSGRRAVLDLYRAEGGEKLKETWLLTGYFLGPRSTTDVPVNLKKIKEPLFFNKRS